MKQIGCLLEALCRQGIAAQIDINQAQAAAGGGGCGKIAQILPQLQAATEAAPGFVHPALFPQACRQQSEKVGFLLKVPLLVEELYSLGEAGFCFGYVSQIKAALSQAAGRAGGKENIGVCQSRKPSLISLRRLADSTLLKEEVRHPDKDPGGSAILSCLFQDEAGLRETALHPSGLTSHLMDGGDSVQRGCQALAVLQLPAEGAALFIELLRLIQLPLLRRDLPQSIEGLRSACQVALIQKIHGLRVALPGSSQIPLQAAGPAHIDQNLMDMSRLLLSGLAQGKGFSVVLYRPIPVFVLAVEDPQREIGR